MDHAQGEFNSLGYSGSNSGGRLVIENSQFDQNQDGFDTNSQNGDEPPRRTAPARTTGSARSPTPTRAGCSCTTTCTTTTTRTSRARAAPPPDRPAPGCRCRAARNDTVMDNRFVHNGAWGAIIISYPDRGQAVHRRDAEFPGVRQGQLPVRRVGRRVDRQPVQRRRVLRQPEQRRLRRGQSRGRTPVDCYSGNTGSAADRSRPTRRRSRAATRRARRPDRGQPQAVPRPGAVRHAGELARGGVQTSNTTRSRPRSSCTRCPST